MLLTSRNTCQRMGTSAYSRSGSSAVDLPLSLFVRVHRDVDASMRPSQFEDIIAALGAPSIPDVPPVRCPCETRCSIPMTDCWTCFDQLMPSEDDLGVDTAGAPLASRQDPAPLEDATEGSLVLNPAQAAAASGTCHGSVRLLSVFSLT